MMNETTPALAERPQRFQFDWVLRSILRPWSTFPKLVEQPADTWRTPLLVLTLAAVLLVLVAGPLRREAALNAPAEPPPDFQYYSPEQQEQFLQAQQATSSNTFIYLFPALSALARVWGGWLIVGALLHLAVTLLGGRATMRTMMNLVAWAGLPFAVRDAVRAVYMLASKRLILAPGLSGLAVSDGGTLDLVRVNLLESLDLYIIWHVLLLVAAVRSAGNPGTGKAWTSVLLTQVVALALQIGPAVLLAKLSGLTVIRPFLF
ncbi:MAG: hypothetical protein A2Z17_05415 [Gammaproteobacteria bacterium RBG_16_66_13]|nr:MAG: hypothetical protein A2Z17_05415 [Gammaproteobacteria bacterium RBG_16_66_13]